MAQVIPEVATGKEWERCGRLEEGTSLSLFPPITVEARDRPGDHLVVLPFRF